MSKIQPQSPQFSTLPYTHLHLHTEYSLLDGANKLKELAATLKAQGVSSVAMTDHGNMFGAIDFYKTMKEYGLKPIIGIEAYLHNGDELNDKSNKQRFHLCLFAKNQQGYENLMYLSSQSYIQGFYYFPRINKNILKAHSEGLICSSACLQGEINWHLNTGNERNVRFGAKGYEVAREIALWYKEVFGEDFYLELMRHGIKDQLFIDEQVIRLAKELDIKLIATNDTHYTFKDRAKAQEALMCINMGVKLSDKDRLKHSVCEFYVKSPGQMNELFADIPQAIANTQEIADKCNLELKLGDPTPPNFKFARDYAMDFGLNLPEPEAEFSFANDDLVFEFLCQKGLEERLQFVEASKHDEYKERLEREIAVIKKMKFSGYMLIVRDFIAMAKSKDIAVGPGRGSAAGSLVSYCLKITNLDPLPYNLLFERFLNPERVSMPDIDVDFCQDRRDEVIDYVIEKYGFDKVAQVITFNKLLAKGVIRDVARIFDMPLNEADEFAKLIPDELKITLKDAYSKEPKIAEFIETHQNAKEIWEYSLALEGLNRNAGVHAAGLVISNESLWKKTPLFRPTKNDEKHLVTQYAKDFLEDVDLIKFDFLGLKTLDVIDNATKLIKRRYGKDLIWEQIDLNDKKVYETIQSGNTLGIFQIESGMFQDLSRRMRPSDFNDIIAIVALGRPGPMGSGMVDDYIDIKHGRKKAHYAFKELEPILKDTYGVIVYQEQVMQIVQVVGGFTLGGADNVRRAMGKKKREILDNLKNEYLEGAKKQGFDTEKADDLFELILKFAEYGFNKSHSAAYALVAFQTAFLKTYYPSEFMAALLTSEQNKVEKVAQYIEECKRMGLKFLPPSINKAQSEFSAIRLDDGSEGILYGLGAIKSVGAPAATALLQAREDGEFKDMDDFISRINPSKINKRTVESLIKAGAFDEFKLTRKCLMNNIQALCENSRKIAELKRTLNASLFEADEVTEGIGTQLIMTNEEFELKEKLGYEKEITGIYISGHPLDEFAPQIAAVEHYKSVDFEGLKGSGWLLCIGKIDDFKAMMSKSGKRYGKMQVMDFYSSFEIVVFERNVEEVEDILKDEQRKAQPYAFRLNFKRDENDFSLTLNEIMELEKAKTSGIKAKTGFRNRGDFNGKNAKPNGEFSSGAEFKAGFAGQNDKFNKGFASGQGANFKAGYANGRAEYPRSDYTAEPHEFENLVIELNLNKLDKDRVYEIYEIARSSHNPHLKGGKKLVLKVACVDSCLFYDTPFIISEQATEEIKRRFAS